MNLDNLSTPALGRLVRATRKEYRKVRDERELVERDEGVVATEVQYESAVAVDRKRNADRELVISLLEELLKPDTYDGPDWTNPHRENQRLILQKLYKRSLTGDEVATGFLRAVNHNGSAVGEKLDVLCDRAERIADRVLPQLKAEALKPRRETERETRIRLTEMADLHMTTDSLRIGEEERTLYLDEFGNIEF